ncbi:hypothetical protein BTM25_20290 [Actinomadura rubteroloni]|uniref:Uncharacterized protein n=1 Tax=Actinomadura rubteroloni TaxID=1926885 RepID=A0A2P4URE2_9ACTN|nr:hypothetical protein [Actinomadura rubteroloni]POM27613.1 hypothetical protein BTM25_20290 [Actinomadura rubteroloni]
MATDSEPKPLSEIAAEVGLNISDVAAFSGLDESTVFRLWENQHWLERASGRSLQTLISSVPGIAEYVTTHSVVKRRESLVADLDAAGLTVDLTVLRSSTVAQQHLLNALEAGLQIMRGEKPPRVASYLARFWGREQDRALESLFAGENGLLTDPRPLFDAAIEIAPRLNQRAYSFHSILALNILTHQVSKVTRELSEDLAFEVPGRQSAFMLRGVVMGTLIATDDIDLAERYRRILEATPMYAGLEEWSLPTYARDGRVTSDFTLPSDLSLRHTAVEVLREIDAYNDAYFYYLVSTYLPLALRRDPRFGGRVADLAAAVRRRRETVPDRRIRETCDRLLRRLAALT